MGLFRVVNLLVVLPILTDFSVSTNTSIRILKYLWSQLNQIFVQFKMKVLKYLALVTLILSATTVDKVLGRGGFLDFLFGKFKSNGQGGSNSGSGTSISDDVCLLPAQPGPCRGAFGMWFWDGKRGLCDHFVYGGCAGNGNRFESYRACQRKCSKGTNIVPY